MRWSGHAHMSSKTRLTDCWRECKGYAKLIPFCVGKYWKRERETAQVQ